MARLTMIPRRPVGRVVPRKGGVIVTPRKP